MREVGSVLLNTAERRGVVGRLSKLRENAVYIEQLWELVRFRKIAEGVPHAWTERQISSLNWLPTHLPYRRNRCGIARERQALARAHQEETATALRRTELRCLKNFVRRQHVVAVRPKELDYLVEHLSMIAGGKSSHVLKYEIAGLKLEDLPSELAN
jgi:hypothetical protein